jgi:hypothetical protein
MSDHRKLACAASLLIAVLLAAGCHQPATPSTSAGVEVNNSSYRIHGPFAHENLSVFLLCSDQEDTRDFLTLDEGLPKGVVKITEQEQETVGSLQIENLSDRPLYLQEGERLQGGKQDRVILTSLVLQPKSGKTAVPTLCVEQSRWVEGDKGRSFGFTLNAALAPKGVRGAAKVEGDQSKVWKCVEVQKGNGNAILKTANTNSSVNELLDAPQVRSLSDDYTKALSSALESEQGRKAVGVTIVLNGHIEEANVYPNHALFARLFPRLIQSYALQAAMLKDQGKASEPVTAETVAQFLKEGGEKSKQEKTLAAHNTLGVCELEGNRFQCTTTCDGHVVHWQVLRKNGAGQEARAKMLGNDW